MLNASVKAWTEKKINSYNIKYKKGSSDKKAVSYTSIDKIELGPTFETQRVFLGLCLGRNKV
jgi:hypothetical protein